MRVGVVLCAFNGARFLDAQLHSILLQSRPPDILLIVDDASDDLTYDVVATVLCGNPSSANVDLRFVRNVVRKGVARNFSDALGMIDADIVFLADQDDLWREDKIQRQVSVLASGDECLLVFTNARLVDDKGSGIGCDAFGSIGLVSAEINAVHSGHAFRVFANRAAATGATMAFRSELLALALPIGTGWLHDEWLAIIASAVGDVDVIEDCLIDYRQHEGNVVGMRVRTWRDKWDDLRKGRAAQFQQELRRLSVLRERLVSLGDRVAPWKLALLDERMTRLRWRVHVGTKPHARRVLPVLRELWSGRYARFGTGWRSALRDLLRRD